jgi:hypothetical protein
MNTRAAAFTRRGLSGPDVTRDPIGAVTSAAASDLAKVLRALTHVGGTSQVKEHSRKVQVRQGHEAFSAHLAGIAAKR